jgi:hypothetical protein
MPAWGIQIQKHVRDPKGFDLAQLARATDGLTGSEIENVFVGSLFWLGHFLRNESISPQHLRNRIKTEQVIGLGEKPEFQQFCHDAHWRFTQKGGHLRHRRVRRDNLVPNDRWRLGRELSQVLGLSKLPLLLLQLERIIEVLATFRQQIATLSVVVTHLL